MTRGLRETSNQEGYDITTGEDPGRATPRLADATFPREQWSPVLHLMIEFVESVLIVAMYG